MIDNTKSDEFGTIEIVPKFSMQSSRLADLHMPRDLNEVCGVPIRQRDSSARITTIEILPRV